MSPHKPHHCSNNLSTHADCEGLHFGVISSCAYGGFAILFMRTDFPVTLYSID